MRKKLRILLLFPHYNSLNQAGSLRSPQIGMFLANCGYEVTAFAPGVDLRRETLFPELAGKLYSDNIVDGVRVIRPRCIENFRKSMPRRFLFELIFALSVIPLLLKIKIPHIIVGAYPPAVLPAIGLLISKILRIPFIFEVRDLMADALVANDYSKSRFFNHGAMFVENFIYKHCDHIVTVSDGIRDIIVKKGIKKSKITPIKNGYEPQVFMDVVYSFKPRNEFGWGERFVVIYAGGLTESYDISTLLKCAELLRDGKDIIFSIIGNGNKKSHYVKLKNQLQLDNVQFLDPRPRKLMPAILSRANVGVHLFPDDPLWGYVLGNKPFDYLGSAIPMIYSGIGDMAKLVRDAGAGFVIHPERPEQLAEKILWLKEHPEDAKMMGKKGQEYVQTHFNRFKLLEGFDKLIRFLNPNGL